MRRLCLGLLLSLAACSSINPYYDPAIPHRGRDGFHNNYATAREYGYWRWQWERWRDGLPHPPANGYHFPMASPEVAFLRANRSETTLTWIGHATVLLQVGGQNILTDPHLSARASPVSFAGPKRRVPPGLTFEQLPHIDVVVISHNHYDHLDVETVTRLAAQAGGPPRFFVPLGQQRWFNALGITTVTELDWWESRELAGLKIHFVPDQHWSQRTLADRNQTLWGGWVIEHPALRFFFTGDTGYSPDFKEIARRFGSFDLAAIPIGAYAPRWFMGPFHVEPGGGRANPSRSASPLLAGHTLGHVRDDRRTAGRTAGCAAAGTGEARHRARALLRPAAWRDVADGRTARHGALGPVHTKRALTPGGWPWTALRRSRANRRRPPGGFPRVPAR